MPAPNARRQVRYIPRAWGVHEHMLSGWWPGTAADGLPSRPQMSHRDISERARADRLDVIRTELIERIRPICSGMPQELFLEMIDGMASIQLKYELRNTGSES